MSTHLHFTFGPVQGFVAQARRTRDLFSGSFLLSHLARAAMKATNDAGGKILLPKFDALQKLADDPNTKHGGAPNRFVAEFSDENAAATAARSATKALQDEWQKIAAVVWKKFLAPVAPFSAVTGASATEIWERQTENFWEISWAIGTPDKNGNPDGSLLDRRKNWRTPPLTTEGGDHCTLMPDYQELSGFIRSQQRSKQDVFWAKLRANAAAITHNALNLDPDERLCAIAFVKRFFPDIAKETIGRNLDASTWPSTADIAAAPWLRKIKSNKDAAAILNKHSEFKFAHVGNFLNRTALENERDTPLTPERRRELKAALSQLEELTKDRAGNFYAVLLMDGDSMGKLLRKHGAANVTTALTAFSAATPAIVKNHDSECVYAGGDDLLALLPLDKALSCAAVIRNHYTATFAEKLPDAAATISGAVVFAHYHAPLRRVLHHAHQRLENDAKEGAGRDAIAISVLKPGGTTCQWVGKFDRFLTTNPDTNAPENCFTPLIKKFRDDTNDGTSAGTGGVTISSKFLYNLRTRFADFSGTRSDFVRLFTAELIHGRLDKDPGKAKQQREAAAALMEKLTDLCIPNPTTTAEQPKPLFKLDFDCARLVRFLALDGKEGNE
ncbi:type III-B CRISPR-associated protein Cas10/Cmr2 [Geminisphaera colitermitum]|uniref:type III-B CRISPR-associated protein Cas10/Cmr2 n=1 Tax=Geminisphaera colitermitum TaxID=1148786 RepID=UPI000158D178|nr:type III-B CRISPR-associated protein Cas10/Cmr2 [Geminisphaera colitermitum]